MGDKETINITDAVRLKHSLNQSITYGRSDLNAQQIEELKRLDSDQILQLNEILSDIRKSWWLTPNWVWWGSALVVIFIILFISRETLPMVVALFVFGYCVIQLGFRAGHQQGFSRGYEDGHCSGVYKALGIDAKEIKDLHERSKEMLLDENVIANMVKKKNT